MILKEKELTHLVYGSALLGSGGGGAITTGIDFVSRICEIAGENGIELITGQDTEGQACVICDIGAISALLADQAQAILQAFETYAIWNNRRDDNDFKAVLPIETGPENSLAPFIIAAHKNIPVLDADGAGRAVPQLNLCTFSALDNPVVASVANDRGNWILISCNKAEELDDLLRPVTANPVYGSSGSMALWNHRIQDLLNVAVPGSISRAIMTGSLLEGLRTNDPGQIQEALPSVNTLSARLLAGGIISDIEHTERNAFDFDIIHLQASEGKKWSIYSQNENLLLIDDTNRIIIAQAPESICMLDTSFHPLTNSELKPGIPVHIIGIAPDPKLATTAIINGFSKLLEDILPVQSIPAPPPSVYTPLGGLLQSLAITGQKNQDTMKQPISL